MRLLLDTHVFVWSAIGHDRLTRAVEAFLLDADNALLVSTVSFWELAIKERIGKSELKAPLSDLVDQYLVRFRASELAITRRHVLEVSALPLHHRDPFDLLLVAQARVEGLTLVTVDPQIARYDVPTVWPTN